MIDTSWVEIGQKLGSRPQNQARRLEHHEAPEFFEWLRSQSTIPGTHYVDVYSVVVNDGKAIHMHDHDEEVVLYYVQPAGTPIQIEDDEYLPEQGEVLVVPPKTMHAVPMHHLEEKRISIAMKVATPNE